MAATHALGALSRVSANSNRTLARVVDFVPLASRIFGSAPLAWPRSAGTPTFISLLANAIMMPDVIGSTIGSLEISTQPAHHFSVERAQVTGITRRKRSFPGFVTATVCGVHRAWCNDGTPRAGPRSELTAYMAAVRRWPNQTGACARQVAHMQGQTPDIAARRVPSGGAARLFPAAERSGRPAASQHRPGQGLGPGRTARGSCGEAGAAQTISVTAGAASARRSGRPPSPRRSARTRRGSARRTRPCRGRGRTRGRGRPRR